MARPNHYLCYGGPMDEQVLVLNSGDSSLPFTVTWKGKFWKGQYIPKGAYGTKKNGTERYKILLWDDQRL